MHETKLIAGKHGTEISKIVSSPYSGNSSSRNSSIDQILFLQKNIGNRAVEKLVRSRALQAKLKIGQKGDKYEQEADRIAQQVMRMPEPSVRLKPGCPLARGSSCKEREEILKTKEVSGKTAQSSESIESRINNLKDSGQPLPESVGAFFKPRFGHDFSHVRMHTDAKAAEAARIVNARAYTIGRDVVFGEGQFSPGTFAGRSLIAHELSHTLQQSGGLQPDEKGLRQAVTSSTIHLQKEGMGELRVSEGLSEERAREVEARARITSPQNMAGRILTDGDIERATRAAPGAASPTRITPGVRGARFVLHDTAALVGAARISEHQQRGRRSSGEGAGAWAPRDTPAVIAHQPFFGPRRPAATQFERGQDVMVKATRESEYRAVWMATNQAQREAILDSVLSVQGSPAAEAAAERSTAIRELAARSGDVHSAGAWAVEDICRSVSNGGGASLAASPLTVPTLEGACQRLGPLLNTRAARIGSTVNVEIVQEQGSDCRTTGTLTPLQPYTANQYTNVMQLYIKAALEARFFPEITTHLLIDRGIGNHCDPRCFNLTALYREITTALGHLPGSTYGITPAYGTGGTDNVWWNDTVCGGPHP